MRLQENLTKLEFDNTVMIADSYESLINLIKTNPKDYRILIDENAKLILIGNLKDIIHIDLLVKASAEGWYYNFVKDDWESLQDYYSDYVDSGKLYPLIFSLDGKKELGYDGNMFSNEYDFGYIYTKHPKNLLPKKLRSLIGKPKKIYTEKDAETIRYDEKRLWDDWTKNDLLGELYGNISKETYNKILDIPLEKLKDICFDKFGKFYSVKRELSDIEDYFNESFNLHRHFYADLHRQLIEYVGEENRVQVLNQTEFINFLTRYRYEYRITYDELKNWYIIGTAFDHIHEEILYQSAPAYGFTIDEMQEYYNQNHIHLFDLLFTPREYNIKVGFDHNDKAYIFNSFGTVYTKGTDLPKVLLNDLTDRYGKPKCLSVSKKIKEEIVYHGGITKEESDGLKYYAFDKKYVKLFHPNAKITKHEINPKNTFDYSNPKHVQMLLDKLPKKINIKNNYRNFSKEYTKEEISKILKGDKNTLGNWMILEDKTIQGIIKSLGFDSMYLLEYSLSGKEWKNIAVFESLKEDTVSLETFKFKKNVESFTSDLLDMGKQANPSNPYDWVADKMEDMSKWNKKDWEYLFKKELTFKDIRDAQTTFETISKEVRKIADAYAESIRFTENLTEQKAYHGSNVDFDKFDLSKFQRGDYGYGIYFTHTKSYASNYGKVKEYEIPNNEYLLDWDFNDQSEIVENALYQIWQDTKDKDKEKKIEQAIYGDYSNTGECIYYAISEVLGLSAKETSEFLYKYGIKGTESFKGNCQVVFNPDDIKKLGILKSVNEALERFI